MATTNGITPESDGPASIDDLVEEVRPLLIGIDEARQAKILADLADDHEDAASRTKVVRRYRASARRHGVRLTAIACGLSRYQFLLFLADLAPLAKIYIDAGQRLHLLDALDVIADERDAAKDAARDISADGKGNGVKS